MSLSLSGFQFPHLKNEEFKLTDENTDRLLIDNPQGPLQS